MIEYPDFLPLGSVVSLKGNPKKLMITSRGVLQAEDDVKKYFDYCTCLYPEGVQGEAYIFCNHDQVDEVHFRGFECEEDAEYLALIAEALENTSIEKGNPSPIGEW